jgi:O-antigen/teichoic acid export membrane protein
VLRSIRVLRNIVTNYLRFVVTGLLGFVVTPFMVRHLGDGNYGLWVTIFSVTGYFGLFDQGIRPSLVRYVSRDHTRSDLDGLSRTVSSALALYSVAGAVTLIATAVVAFMFTRWFHITPQQADVARATLLLAGASLAIGFPFGVFGATLSGLQRYDIANTIGIIVSVARAVAFVIVLRMGGGLAGLALTSLVMNLAGHLWSWIAVRQLLPELTIGKRFVTREHLMLVGSYGGIAFLGALANSVAFQTDAIVITAFLGAAAVTPFALAATWVDNVRTLVHSATWVLSPTASEFDTRGENEKLHAMMIFGSKYSVLLSWPVLFGLIIFGRNLLVTWMGPHYEYASRLITILAVPTLISLPQSTASSVLFGVSRHKGVVALALLNAGANLALSLWWVRPFGITGVAMGTAVPLALVGGVATIAYGGRALGLPLGRYLWEGLLQPGAVTIAFLVPALLMQRWVHPVGWLPLFGTCAGCWVVFAGCAWRWGLGPSERNRWTRMVPGLFGSRVAVASGDVPG